MSGLPVYKKQSPISRIIKISSPVYKCRTHTTVTRNTKTVFLHISWDSLKRSIDKFGAGAQSWSVLWWLSEYVCGWEVGVFFFCECCVHLCSPRAIMWAVMWTLSVSSEYRGCARNLTARCIVVQSDQFYIQHSKIKPITFVFWKTNYISFIYIYIYIQNK